MDHFVELEVGVSNKHAHLSQEHLDRLFGKGYELTFLRNIKQPDEFVSNETVDVIGANGIMRNVRILGPARQKSQVELTLTNARELGIDADIRLSGHTENTKRVELKGPHGQVLLPEGIIVPQRHIHMTPGDAEKLGLSESQLVSVETFGTRGIILKNVVIRIDPLFSLELHLDTDEANAAALKTGDKVRLLLNT
jgi:putative phosphotransacetylase